MTAEVIQLPVRFAGLISKGQLSRSINRSTRWIEIQQRDNGLPYTRDENGFCQYDLEAVRAWKAERERVA